MHLSGFQTFPVNSKHCAEDPRRNISTCVLGAEAGGPLEGSAHEGDPAFRSTRRGLQCHLQPLPPLHPHTENRLSDRRAALAGSGSRFLVSTTKDLLTN